MVLLFPLLLPLLMLAQTSDENASGAFSFVFENDLVAGTDRCFTGGIKFAWMSKGLKNEHKNRWLKWMPFVKKPGFVHFISFSAGQIINTPDDISRSDLIEEDRPYAGLLYLGVGIQSISHHRMDGLEIDIGIIGPHSFGEQSQTFIHRITKGVQPRGWGNQLKDELALGLFYERKWKFSQPDEGHGFGFDLIPQFGGGIGTIAIYAGTGIQFRMGWNLPSDFGISLTRPAGDNLSGFWRRGGFSLYAVAAVDGKAVARNIFLDGNTWRDSHRVEKIPFTADILAGIGLRIKGFNLCYTYAYWTKRFKAETRAQVFGVLTIAFSL